MKYLIKIVVMPAVVLSMSACDRAESSSVAIREGQVARINGCHLKLDQIRVHSKDVRPIGDFFFVCGAAESALKEKNWWGDQTEPLMFGMYVGDCVRLDKIFYCVETMEPGKSATLAATYESQHSDGTLIRRVK